MSERRTVYRNSDGIRRTYIEDESEPGIGIVKTEQDIEEILAGIARDRDLMRHGINKKLATLPAIVVEDLIKRGIYDDHDAFKKWLNGPEAAPWRVWKGQV